MRARWAQDHLITMTQNLNHYEKILSRSHSNYLAQISIEMTDANNQINDVLSKLTALGTVLIPMNLVTGKQPRPFRGILKADFRQKKRLVGNECTCTGAKCRGECPSFFRHLPRNSSLRRAMRGSFPSSHHLPRSPSSGDTLLINSWSIDGSFGPYVIVLQANFRHCCVSSQPQLQASW
jgi:hypothetical protein